MKLSKSLKFSKYKALTLSKYKGLHFNILVLSLTVANQLPHGVQSHDCHKNRQLEEEIEEHSRPRGEGEGADGRHDRDGTEEECSRLGEPR